jgi:hypothetical protein
MTKTLAFILTATLAACAGEAEVHYSGDASAPELVALDIDPSVQVVANADEPIFFVENTYYLYRDNRWYRSRSHRSGWVKVEAVPEHIGRIERPMAYVHFRHGSNPQRTTFNQRDQVPPQPIERERTQPDQLPSGTMREPNPQGPNQPYPNPLPPQQVPPSPDREPVLHGQPNPPMPPAPVPTASPDRDHPDHPDHPINPALEHSQNAPGQDRATDQRPTDQRSTTDRSTPSHERSDSARDQGKRRPDPDKDKKNKDKRDGDDSK